MFPCRRGKPLHKDCVYRSPKFFGFVETLGYSILGEGGVAIFKAWWILY